MARKKRGSSKGGSGKGRRRRQQRAEYEELDKYPVMPPHAFAITKRQLGLWPTSLEGALEMEAMAQAACFSTSEFAEGRAAFGDKRTPVFRG